MRAAISSVHLLTVATLLMAGPAQAESLQRPGLHAMTPPVKDRLAQSRKFMAAASPLSLLPIHPYASGVNQCALWPANLTWQNAQTIRVCFVDRNAQWKEQFVSVAKTWIEHRPDLFDFGAPPTYNICASVPGGIVPTEHVRVGFLREWDGKRAGNWGCVGSNSVRTSDRSVECGQIAVSLNINPETFNDDPNSAEFRHAVLHEMGHALGFEHEHQHREIKCWDTEVDHDAALILYRPMNLEQLTDIFGILTDSNVIFFDYDPRSVMKYFMPQNMFRSALWNPPASPRCYAEMAASLSDADKTLVRKYYPWPPALPSICDRAPDTWWMSRLDLPLAYKVALGAELTSLRLAGAADKDPAAIGKSVTTFTLQQPGRAPLDSLPDVPMTSTGPHVLQAPTDDVRPFAATLANDCTPDWLKGKARCTISEDGTTLRIETGE